MTTVTSLKATLVAGAALGALATTALPAMAADLIEPTIIEAPVIEKVKPFGGWYLRADVGYSFNDYRGDGFDMLGGAKANPNGGVGQPAIPLFTERDLDDSFFVGVGLGGHLGQYLRADITADYYFDSEVQAAIDITGGCATAGDPSCVNGYSADLEAITVMANAYVDLGTYAGITPYVGAGIGFAHVEYGDVTETRCEPPLSGAPAGKSCGSTINPTNVVFTDTFEGDSSLRLAWSLAAGASYDINHQFAIDGGYRYVRIAEGELSRDAGFKDNGIDMHQVRVGARVKLH